MIPFANVIIACLSTIVLYQIFARIQKKLNLPLLNPMLLTMLSLISLLVIFDIDFIAYQQATHPLNFLLELSVITLGYPLYQHLHTIKKQWKAIMLVSLSAAILAISSGYWLTWLLTRNDSLAVALSLKSITTPIALLISERHGGNIAMTAFTIVLAGLFGAIFGIRWLSLLGVEKPEVQGLAIGTASHALGTATISQISYQHAAFSSLALILSAVITAFLSPILIPLLREVVVVFSSLV